MVAIKIAPFNRYQTLDVVRAVAESGRDDMALYTGNDDNIVLDLLTPYRFRVGGREVERRIVGGLLGHWAVWTQPGGRAAGSSAMPLSSRGDASRRDCCGAPVEVTDCQRRLLRRRPRLRRLHRRAARGAAPAGLLEGIWCLDPDEGLSPGQREEIDRVYRRLPASERRRVRRRAPRRVAAALAARRGAALRLRPPPLEYNGWRADFEVGHVLCVENGRVGGQRRQAARGRKQIEKAVEGGRGGRAASRRRRSTTWRSASRKGAGAAAVGSAGKGEEAVPDSPEHPLPRRGPAAVGGGRDARVLVECWTNWPSASDDGKPGLLGGQCFGCMPQAATSRRGAVPRRRAVR